MPADAAAANALREDNAAAFTPVVAAVKAGDLQLAPRLLMDVVNDQPGLFESRPKAVQQMLLDNARTLGPAFLGPRSPPVTCEQLARIKAPVAVSRGELTRATFRIRADEVVRCIPGARLVVGAGQRHSWPSLDPASFNAALRAFIAANP